MMIVLIGGFLVGCVSYGSDVDTVSSASQSGWSITLKGLREDTVDQDSYDGIVSQYGRDIKVERKGVMHTYHGIPLSEVIARIDGTDAAAPFSFDRSLWESGYDVTLTSVDGYAATFSTAEMPVEALYLVDSKDGEKTAPGIVGVDVSTKYWIKDIVSISCDLGTSTKPLFALQVLINDDQFSFTLDDLEKTPYYVGGLGGYTTSAGTYYEHRYSGVRFADFLRSFVPLSDENSITVVATDGYEMTYAVSDLLDEDDGIWILATKEDGEPLPLDPGYIRTIKIASSDDAPVPNIDGHNSAKMVGTIKVSADTYRDFSLKIIGKMDYTIDRTTLQSGVNCTAHKKVISYYNRKSDTVEHYTGMPLYYLLAFGDDPEYAPHKQTDKKILSYDAAAAERGYSVRVTAADGYSVTLDSRDLHENKDVIIAMYQDGKELSERDWPLKLVWDKDAERVPEGIKAIRNVVSIELLFE